MKPVVILKLLKNLNAMDRNNLIFLHVGLGSMGKRRIRNLLHCGISRNKIFGFDFSENRADEVAKEYGIKTFNNFERAVAEAKPSALIISTPPNQHHPYFLFAAKHKINFFVEVTTREDGYDELFPLLDGSFVAAPSCTYRYFPAVKKMKEVVSSNIIGRPLSFNHYLGQYLPDWHPYEDYRKVYFAQKETGGCREMFPYELVWLTDIFGSGVEKTIGIHKKISDLEITADDLYTTIVKLKNGVFGSVMIDLLNRKASRSLLVVGTSGTLEWNWLGNKIMVYTANDKKEFVIDVPVGEKIGQYTTSENPYQEEMGDFLLALEGKQAFPYTFTEDLSILRGLDFLNNELL